MAALLAAVCALCLQTIVGAAVCALLGPLDGSLAACSRALRAPAIWAAVSGSIGLAAGAAAGIDPRWLLEPVRTVLPGAFTAAGALVATGCHLVLHAGRAEAAGLPEVPVVLPRGGGKVMFLGADLSVALIVASALVPGSAVRAAIASGGPLVLAGLFAGGVACALGGFAGLLAGISGKPRPSGPVAAALYFAGLVLTAGAMG